MAESDILGRDLDAGFVADDEGRVFAGPPTQADLQARRREDVAPRTVDLATSHGRANLVQSLLLRLLTEQGELSALGHPEYGSRHHRLVGEPNTENNRALLKLYVLECLRQEPRLESVVHIEVAPGAGRERRDSVDVRLEIKVKSVPDPLSLVVPFSFQAARP